MGPVRLVRVLGLAALAVSLGACSAPQTVPPTTQTGIVTTKSAHGHLTACASRWLEVQAWAASPLPAGPNRPPTMMREFVRVDSSGHTCSLSSGWLRLTSIRSHGSPYASIHQTDVGQGSKIVLSAGEFAVGKVELAVPWFIPYDNLCASEVSVGVTPPGSQRASRAFFVWVGCSEGFAGALKARVGALYRASSGVHDARGPLVAHLQPGPMAVGPSGTLYISEPSLDRVVARLRDGSFKVIAGTGRAGYSGDGGPAARAMLSQPEGLAAASNGALYIADFGNNRVREVLPDGIIETVAGSGGKAPETIPIDGLPGGPALKVHMWSPSAIAIGHSGALYIAVDNENAIVKLDNGAIRTVITGKDLKSIAYFARDQLCGPAGIALDAHGDLYFDCAYAALTLMLTPAGRIVSRGEWESGGFSPLSAAGGGQVDIATTAGIVRLTRTSQQTIQVPRVFANVGLFELEGIALDSGGTIYLDQSGGNGPPAIVARRDGRLIILWAADT